MKDNWTDKTNEINTDKNLVMFDFLVFETFKNMLRSQGSLLRIILEHIPDYQVQ